jgi:DNA-binding NarL/FixJ family response regulator
MRSILIVEDVAEVREWLEAVVADAFPGSTVRVAKDRRSALYLSDGDPFDLALIDLNLPDGEGADVIAAIREKQPDALIVVATVMGDDNSIIGALAAGAHGYLLKDTQEALFIRQLRQLNDGLPALSPAIARRIISHFGATATRHDEDAQLTARETEVLGLIGKGLRNSEAARALGLTDHTIASHIKSIYSKLGISSRAEAAIQANRLGLN